MNLPDIDKMYPQEEPTIIQTCDSYNCSDELLENQMVTRFEDNLYCDDECLLDHMYRVGHAVKVVAGV